MIFQYPLLNLQTHPPSISFFLLLKMLMLTPVSIKVIPLSSQGPQCAELMSSTLYLPHSPLWRHIPSDLNLLKSLFFVYTIVHTRACAHTHTHTHTHTNSPQNFISTTSLSPALTFTLVFSNASSTLAAFMFFHRRSSSQCSSCLMPPFY